MKSSRGIGLLISSVIGFIFLCWVAASDAQGAIALVLYAPVPFALAAIAVYWLRSTPLKILPMVWLAFLAAFYASSFTPKTRPISNGVITLVSRSFERVTGQSPYAWVRRRSAPRTGW